MQAGNPASKPAASLRERARQWLTGDVPLPESRQWEPGVDALAILYRLAGNTETSADALKLLHELQVHQVELSLQQEELQRVNAELTSLAVANSRPRDFAPIGYLTLDASRHVVDGSGHAARLLGIEAGRLSGCSVYDLFAEESWTGLTICFDALVGASSPAPPVDCRGREGRRLAMIADAATGGGVHVALLDAREWTAQTP